MAASAGFFLSPQQTDIFTAAPDARTQLAILIEGEFDRTRLKDSLGQVVRENEALRTTFQRQTGMKMPFQVVLDELAPVWAEVDTTPSETDGAGFARSAMDHEAQQAIPSDGSQLRSCLFSAQDGQVLWVLTAQSAVADSKSLQLIFAQTVRSYTGATVRGEETLRYVQFGQWQSDLLQESDEAAEEGKKFWSAQITETSFFAGVPAESMARGGEVRRVDLLCNGDLGKVAGQESSPSDITLAAWSAVIGRWSGQQRLRIGRVAEGREYEELHELIGPVEKMLPLVVTLKPHLTFSELIQHVHSHSAEAVAMQEYCAPERSFDTGIAWHELAQPISAAGALFSPLVARNSAHQCALKLNVCSGGGRVAMELEYQPALVSDELVQELAAGFRSLLQAGSARPEEKVSRLPIISDDRKQELLTGWAGASVPVDPAPVHVLISAQAARTPNSIAVRSGEEALTYAELEAASNQLARYLVSCGVRPGALVGLSVDRSARMMVPVLAILKAGAAYVPLSGDQPKARTEQQLAGLEVLITESKVAPNLPEFAGRTIVLDRADDSSGPGVPLLLSHLGGEGVGSNVSWEKESRTDPAVVITDDALAYVIYTSGSTGTPKGVGVRHRNLVNYATHIVRALELEPGLQFATVSTLAADLGNTVIYPALLTGGCLHVLPYEVATDAGRLAAYNAQYGIDVLKIVPSHLAALLDAGDAAAVLPRKYLITGGEALKPALAERVAAHCAVINHYGPTETTVGSLMLPLKDFDWKGTKLATIPIGRPISNTRVYVLDANRELVPVGVPGELYIAGAGVTAGYIGQPERTEERFLADPFDPDADSKMYRTGDLVRWLPSGLIEFLGRTDDQVKIRGYRVELGEIESVLAAQPGVRQSLVLALSKAQPDSATDDKQVIAYVVLDRQHGVSVDVLKQALKDRLPDYMVPAAFVELAKLPLTANGKVDRQQLPEPEERVSRVYMAPATATEELVAQIWAGVLKVERISSDENFFDLGGHSLLATQVISRIREGFQLEIPLRTMFESPVLHNFAAAIDKANGSGTAAVGAPIRRAVRQAYRANSAP